MGSQIASFMPSQDFIGGALIQKGPTIGQGHNQGKSRSQTDANKPIPSQTHALGIGKFLTP
jgi:hypothetical protein